MRRIPAERFRLELFRTGILTVLLAAAFSAQTELRSQTEQEFVPDFFLDSIRYHRINIADTSEPTSGFDRLMNATHILTKESVVSTGAELTVALYDTVTDHSLDELELYLRDLDIFSAISYDVTRYRGPQRGRGDDPNAPLHGMLNLRTQDSWTLYPEPYTEIDDDRVAWVLKEGNFLGYAKKISVGGDLSSPSDSNWRGFLIYRDPDLFGTHYRMDGALRYSEPLTRVRGTFERPFYSNKTPRTYGLRLHLADGEDRFYFRNLLRGDGDLFYISDTNISTRYGAETWVGFSNKEKDQFRSSISLSYNVIDPESGTYYPRAFDNSVGLFGGLSSLRRNFVHIRDYEISGTALVPIGGQGRISIGKIFPINDGLDDLIYVGAEARQSVLWGDFYGFGSVQAGTALREKEAELTLFRAEGSCAFPAGPGIVAAKMRLANIWRWPRYVLQSLGSGEGRVRGLAYLDAFGDNMLIGNFDYRLFPVLDVGFWDVGLAAFADIGGAWDQGQLFSKTQFYPTAGLGIRLGNSGGIDGGFLRVDVAWDFRGNRVGLDLGVQEAFDVFGTLDYSPPAPYIP